MKINMV